LKDKKIRPVMQ